MNEIVRWCYKTVHYELKKEGLLGGIFLDEAEIEESLNDFGKAGWELVSLLEIHGGLIAIFKQPINFASSLVEEREKEIITPRREIEEENYLDEVNEAEDAPGDIEKPQDSDDVGTIRIE